MPARSLSASHKVILYSAFALTGAVVVLLGPILPVLEQRWHIPDGQAGILFTAQFLSSTICAIFAARNVRLSAVLGMALAAIGLAALPGAGFAISLLAVTIYGSGTGLVITAINLLIAIETPQKKAASELAFINLIWVMGAIAFPAFYTRAAPQIDQLVFALAAVAFCGAVALAFLFRGSFQGEVGADPVGAGRFRPLSVVFAIFFFLYVGTEVATAGWIATHMQRRTGHEGSQAVVVFWCGLILGRVLTMFLLKRLPEQVFLLGALCTALAGSAGIVAADSVPALLMSTSLAGLGFAPLFPINLALFARTIPAHRNSGWVLASGGLGAAVLPALIGAISTRTSSLSTGMLVLPVTISVLIVIALTYRGLQRMDPSGVDSTD
jgi:FHS family glucose/mannose:H+ symporter-like MFS transporter